MEAETFGGTLVFDFAVDAALFRFGAELARNLGLPAGDGFLVCRTIFAFPGYDRFFNWYGVSDPLASTLSPRPRIW